MKEIFDWMREQMLKRKSAWEEDSIADKVSAEKHIGTWNVALRILEKAEAKWKENERKCEDCAGCTNWKCDCENIRNKAIDEFAERMQRKSDWIETYTRAFGHTGATIRETLKEIASQMKGEKE